MTRMDKISQGLLYATTLTLAVMVGNAIRSIAMLQKEVRRLKALN